MSRSKRKIFLIVMIFALILIGMSTIIKAEDTPSEKTELKLSYSEVDVLLNGTKYILEESPSGETITWSSSDQSVATVNEYGTVSGIKIGKTTITATTSGGQTASCEVSVVYYDMTIGGNEGKSVNSVALVLGEHPTENLKVTVRDGDYAEVEDATITWKSSDPSVATVDNTGKVTGVSVGKTTITVTAAGVSDTCEINVVAAPQFTDFSNAKYELLFDTSTDLKISEITPKDQGNDYYYIITSDNKKPAITINKYGGLDTEATIGEHYLSVNINEKYIYRYNMDEFVELNQDLYLWVIEDRKLDSLYYDENANYVSHSTKFVVEGQKLTRPELPQLNLILKSLSIWGGTKDGEEDTYIRFRFPSAAKNRKFKLKIGKVTDNSILQKIQKNDYSGIIELLQYAKNNEAIYTENLTTTSENHFINEQALFDGVKLLEDDAYYYIYAEFDDENGKYYPIEGVTLGQAYISDVSEYWRLYAYTEDNFKWNNLSSSYTEDDTLAKDNLPDTGVRMIIVISILTLTGTVVFFKIKNNKYKEI